MKTYKKRLQIPVEPNRLLVNNKAVYFEYEKNFYSKHGKLLLAHAYYRVVIGQRGPYVEFDTAHIEWDKFYVPDDQIYRHTSKVVYYDEWRSKDIGNVKLYMQKRTVTYADYKIGRCYMSPFDLCTESLTPVIV